MSDQKPMCFVVGPIGEAGSTIRRKADWLLIGIIKSVLEATEFNFHVKRADDDDTPGSIADAVIIDVLEADLVVADLTGFNPNAFYELGLRHMTEKPTVHIIAENVKLPFDNYAQRTIFFELDDIVSIEKGKARLAEAVRTVLAPGFAVRNPVTQARGKATLAQSSDSRDQIIFGLSERLNRLEAQARYQSVQINAAPQHAQIAAVRQLEFSVYGVPSANLLSRIERLDGVEGVGIQWDGDQATLICKTPFGGGQVRELQRQIYEEISSENGS